MIEECVGVWQPLCIVPLARSERLSLLLVVATPVSAVRVSALSALGGRVVSLPLHMLALPVTGGFVRPCQRPWHTVMSFDVVISEARKERRGYRRAGAVACSERVSEVPQEGSASGVFRRGQCG